MLWATIHSSWLTDWAYCAIGSMKLNPLPPISVVPIAPGKAALPADETTLRVWAAGTLGLSVRLRVIPLRLNVCSTRWRMAASKFCCCWAVGWPPKTLATCALSYHGCGLPVVIRLASGYIAGTQVDEGIDGCERAE